MNIAASSSLLLQAAAAVAGDQQYPAGALYVVATPIGNLADLTLRAIHALALMDAVACEDTRVTGSLLRYLGIEKKALMSVHEHNEHTASAVVIDRLKRGERVAYVSDAGTPAVSDPGAALVAAVQAAGFRTVPLPGASSVLAALSVSGDGARTGFRFVGFLPTRAKERVDALSQALGDGGTFVIFEAPHRIEALLSALAAEAPSRRVTLCRELTKQFETVATLPAVELPAWLAADNNRSRGEFVVVIHSANVVQVSEMDAQAERVLSALVRELPLKQAVALAVELTAMPRNQLYQRALALREASGEDSP